MMDFLFLRLLGCVSRVFTSLFSSGVAIFYVKTNSCRIKSEIKHQTKKDRYEREGDLEYFDSIRQDTLEKSLMNGLEPNIRVRCTEDQYKD
ncbi:hypothetical protein EUGRSUZ_C00503 [Eucalyptus grandis]|uniref:Uncharacterized protein n=2 Tax=Eucalyptus grandis TaxID=71139 RepID=A0ACC3LA12_EUCGR|nr:hypothetical protein EUGRSUZ_C00503 [Eucalyptus grandis]